MTSPVRAHLQLLVNFHQCAVETRQLKDAFLIRRQVRGIILQNSMEVICTRCHRFTGRGNGVTAVFIVAESHLIVHTWPEKKLLNLDIFFCNFTKENASKARRVLQRFTELYRPRRTVKRSIRHTW